MPSFVAVVGVLSLAPALAAVDREYAKALATIAGPQDYGIKAVETKPVRLVKPIGLAVDATGRLFVADPGNQAVVIYDKPAQKVRRWTGNAEIPLLGPAALALEPSGRLFVADIYKAHVVVFEPHGKAVLAIGKGLLRRPIGLAVDVARGRLYVADMALRQVIPFDIKTQAAGKPIVAPAQTFVPGAVAVNSSGRVFVSDLRSCRIQAFDPDGALLHEFQTACTRPDEACRPMTVGRDDLVYVADPSRNAVEVFDAGGKALFASEIGKPATPPFTKSAIATDADGRVYLTEHRFEEGRVQILQISRTRRAK